MAKRYDATVKQLVEARPEDWLSLLGITWSGPIRIVDADVSSITAAADKVILVEGPRPFIVHLEFQAGADAWLDQRVMFYNVLLRWRHRVPVISIVVLLGSAADHPGDHWQICRDRCAEPKYFVSVPHCASVGAGC